MESQDQNVQVKKSPGRPLIRISRGMLGLDISDKCIRYTYLEKKGGKYLVRKTGKSMFNMDLPSKGLLFHAINRILDDERIHPKEVFVSISQKDTIVYQMKLPKMSKAELKEVLESEIDKLPGFQDCEYDYQFHSYPMSHKNNSVVFAALKEEKINFVLREVKNTEFKFENVSVTPLHIKEVLSIAHPMATHQVALIVDSRQTYITIFDRKEYKLMHRIPVGMEEIQKTVKVQGFQSALPATWSPQIKRIIRAFLAEHMDIKIDAYTIIWDNQEIDNLHDRINQDLEWKFKAFDVGLYTKLSKNIDEQINPIFALALSPMLVKIYKAKHNFSMQHYFENFTIKQYMQKAVFSTVLMLALIVGGYYMGNQILQQQADDVNQQIVSVSQEISKVTIETGELYKQYNTYLQARNELLTQARYVQELNRISWSEVLAVVSKEMPEDLALTSFKFSEFGSATINGETFSMESVAELIRRVEESAFLEKGKFDYLRENTVQDQEFYKFGILAKLRSQDQTQRLEKSELTHETK